MRTGSLISGTHDLRCRAKAFGRIGRVASVVLMAVLGIPAAGGADPSDGPDADEINRRLHQQLGGGADTSQGIERVSGQLYLSHDALDSDRISEALATLLTEQQSSEESVAIQRGPRLNFEIHFEKNSAALTEESMKGLDELGSVLQESYREMRFVVGGHTDQDGDDAVNGPLSQARADSARAYLVERHGIEPDRLVAQGFGTSDPLREVEETPQDKLYNRRVDLRPLRSEPEARGESGGAVDSDEP